MGLSSKIRYFGKELFFSLSSSIREKTSDSDNLFIIKLQTIKAFLANPHTHLIKQLLHL